MKRLKDELNGPTVTEIIHLHKLQQQNQTIHDNNKDDHVDTLEEAPVQLQPNFTLNPSHIESTMPLETQSFARDR